MQTGTETRYADGREKCPRDRSWAQLLIDLTAACHDSENPNQAYTVRFLVREMAERQRISTAEMAKRIQNGTA